MKKALIFDLDGTLLDTSRDIHKVLNATLKKFGLPEVTLSRTLSMVGDGAYKLVERAVGQENAVQVPRIYAEYSKAFAACDNSLTCLFEGEAESLEKFVAAGLKLAIVTNKPQKATERVCSQYLEKFGFAEIIGYSGEFPLKPDPSAVLEIIGKFRLKKEDCLFIGDGDADVKTAANAGIDCISVLWGYRTEESLLRIGAVKFAHSFKELEKLVFES